MYKINKTARKTPHSSPLNSKGEPLFNEQKEPSIKYLINISIGWLFSKTDSQYIPINIPHTYNLVDADDGGHDYYRGPGYYKRSLNIADLSNKKYLIFHAVSKKADVFLNGTLVGTHRGGYNAFTVDISKHVQLGSNELKVITNNSDELNIIPISADFPFVGGITREVFLAEINHVSFDFETYGINRIWLKQTEVSKGSATLDILSKVQNTSSIDKNMKLHYKLKLADRTVQTFDKAITVPSKGYFVINETISIDKPVLWDGLGKGYLYEVVLQLMDQDAVVDEVNGKIGLRKVEVTNQGFFLNGRQYPLRGINRHAENESRSYALTKEDHDQDIELIKEIGANAVRLAHYPHDHYFIEKLDQLGIVVYMEIPWVNEYPPNPDEEFKDVIRSQFKEMIIDYHNHPSIVFWGISNELGNGDSVADFDQAKILNDELYHWAKSMDPSLVVGHVANNESTTEFSQDFQARNVYYGWYTEKASDLGSYLDDRKANPLLITEYGAGANTKQHADRDWTTVKVDPGSHYHPEEYQTFVHEGSLEQIKYRDWIVGTFVWAMFDFSSDWRNEGDQPGINDKGLVTRDRRIKKDSFYLYKADWSDTPFVYITERRFQTRNSNTISIKVYSNCETVILYKDGEKYQTIDHVNARLGIIFEFGETEFLKQSHSFRAVGIKNGVRYEDSFEFLTDAKI